MSGQHSSISGILEQLPFPEFVQTLANLGKTGKLTLSRFGESGFVFFRDGKIVGAASTSVRETLGSLLVGQRLVTEEELAAGLKVQRDLAETRRLGTILLDLGVLSQEDLRGVIRQQTQRVVSELMRWKNGHFEFETLEIEDWDEFETEIIDVLLPEGFSAESVILAGAVDVDEASDLKAEVEAVGAEPGAARSIASLRDLLLDIRSPEFTGELTTKVMEYASGLAQRCVLFSVQGGHFCGMGYYGTQSDASMLEAVRDLRISVGEPSVLADAAARHEAYKGSLRDDPTNRQIVDCLGDFWPEQVIAAPLVVNGRVTMLIYGDSGPSKAQLGSVAELEVLTLQIGLAMEKRLLEEGREAAVTEAEKVDGLENDDFRSLLDSDPEPIVVVSPAGTILYANTMFADILGRPADELLGDEISVGAHPDDANDLLRVVLEVGRGGAPGGNTVRFRESDDSWRRCYLLPSALGMRSGNRCVMLRALTAGEIHTRYDPLTGLLDSEALVESVGRSLLRSSHEDGEPFAVLFVGVDRFMLINVQHGWARGNEALRTLADRLAASLRPGDVVSRLGGDRFCVVLDRLREASDGVAVAKRTAEFLRQPMELGQETLSLSVSIGVVTSEGDYGSAEEMLKVAKGAMLEAKAKGGMSVVRRS